VNDRGELFLNWEYSHVSKMSGISQVAAVPAKRIMVFWDATM
jgi:hypothetical protein